MYQGPWGIPWLQMPGGQAAPSSSPGAPTNTSPPPSDTHGVERSNTPPSIIDQARKMFPILNNPNLQFLYTPREGPNVPYLETFPPGEGGGPDEPRPKQFAMDKYGIEVYKSDTQPVNVLGDAVVHMMRFTDPTIKKYYEDFEQSLTPQQQAILRRQYQHHVQYNGETRPFDEWYKQSGLTQLFGGYAFGGTKKWPANYYTPEQLKMFDEMMQYLQRPQSP